MNYFVDRCALSLPELHLSVDHCGSVLLDQPHQAGHVEKKNVLKKKHDIASSDSKRKRKKIPKAMTTSDTNGKLRQPTISDVLKKAGASTSREVPNENSSDLSSKAKSFESSQQHPCGSNEPVVVEISAVAKALEAHRYKFRRILVQCFSILTFSNVCMFMLTNNHHFLEFQRII